MSTTFMKDCFAESLIALRSYANAVYAYALFGALKEWVARDFKETPEQVADIVSRSFRH